MMTTNLSAIDLNHDMIEAMIDQARYMLANTFVMVRIDARDVPDEVLGEVLEASDYIFPSWSDEPLMMVEGLGYTPMSNLVIV